MNLRDVKCPYCGHEQDIDHDGGYGYSEDIIYKQECPKCEKYFAYSTAVIFYYKAWQAPCMNEGEHKFEKTNTFPERFAVLECKLCGERKPLENKNG